MSILSKLISRFNAIPMKYQQSFLKIQTSWFQSPCEKIKKQNIQENSEKKSNIKGLILPDIKIY